MELIVQKAVELGASAVVPVASRRCVVKLDAKKADNKVKRWQAIAESAAKQSGKGTDPDGGASDGFYIGAESHEAVRQRSDSL